jgi:hypothetical protein
MSRLVDLSVVLDLTPVPARAFARVDGAAG